MDIDQRTSSIETAQNRPLLAVWRFLGFFVGRMPESTTYHLPCVYTFGVGLEGPIKTSFDQGKTWHEARTVLFRPGCQHQCRFDDDQVGYLLIEPSLVAGQQLATAMRQGGEGYWYDHPDEQACVDVFKRHYAVPRDLNAIQASLAPLIPNVPVPFTDQRVLEIIEHLRTHPADKLDVGALTASQHLSDAHVMRLFKRETHLTLRQVQSWVRMRCAVEWIAQGYKLTAAASLAGYADEAHFSNSFKRIFGLSPSALFAPEKQTEITYLDEAARLSTPLTN